MEIACGFTLQHYKEILDIALSRSFKILMMRDITDTVPVEYGLILRHDIDFSTEDAVKMAVVEHELGVRSTYFVLLHSETYSLGDLASCRSLKKILEMGHDIGLHYDVSFFQGMGVEPNQGIANEASYLGRLLGTTIRCVAQHRPGRQGIHPDLDEKFVDAYSPLLTQEIRYLSDSRREWRNGCVHTHLDNPKSLQLLIHPEWWEQKNAKTRRGTIDRLVQTQQEKIRSEMESYALNMERNPKP